MLLKKNYKNDHIRLGKKGEKIACRLLKNKSCQILAKNFQTKAGEIDIIARDGNKISFIEVKTRFDKLNKGLIYYDDNTLINEEQAKRIHKSANIFLKKIGSPTINYNFELIEIFLAPYRVKAVFHWKNNFGKAL